MAPAAATSAGLSNVIALRGPDAGGAPTRRAARQGGGRVVAVPDAGPAARGLGRAAMALDSVECTRILNEAVDADGVMAAWEQLAVPVLVAIGERWQSTGAGVEVEHLLSECLLGVLRRVTGALLDPVSSRCVLLACTEDDDHTLPVHVLAAALAERGVPTRVLGQRVPRDALAAAVRRCGPAVVFVYAHLPVADAGQLEEMPRAAAGPAAAARGRRLAGAGAAGVGAPGGDARRGGGAGPRRRRGVSLQGRARACGASAQVCGRGRR